jgi:hypothetical protein
MVLIVYKKGELNKFVISMPAGTPIAKLKEELVTSKPDT